MFETPIARFLLPDISKPLRDHTDLALAAMLAWGEARSEGFKGMVATVWTAKNRFLDPAHRWPNKRLGQVILQRWQFSCFNDNDPNLAKLWQPLEYDTEWVWVEACAAAFGVVFGLLEDLTGGANHYHTISMAKYPSWADPGKVTCDIGGHRFYEL